MYNEHYYNFYNFIHLPNIMAFRSIGDKLRFMELYVCFVLSTVNDLYSNIDDGTCLPGKILYILVQNVLTS